MMVKPVVVELSAIGKVCRFPWRRGEGRDLGKGRVRTYAFRKPKDSMKKKASKAERRLRRLEQERFEHPEAFPIVVTDDALLQTYGQGQDQEVDCSSA
jgi:hypothetical protein